MVVFGYIQQDAFKYALENNIEVYDIDKIKSRYIYNNTDNPMNKPRLIKLIRDKALGLCCNHTEDADVYTVYINIKEIYKTVNEYKDGVFAENLRSRLTGSSKSLIANDIQNTIKTRPERLVAMNNGLTITGTEVEIGDDYISIVEPQIVNGCQTSWAIYDVCESLFNTEEYKNLKSFISVKIIKTAIADVSVDVTKSTNTQNPIYIRDTFSNKEEQLELNLAFKENSNQPVLYEHKEGQFNMLKREHNHTLYRAKGNTYRRIDNTFAGQLYIALMGKPSYSKHKMREIFTNQDIYRTIFKYYLNPEERFNNPVIGISCNSIKLRTGKAEFFVEDILFALKIYKFMEIYKGKLKERLDNQDLEEDTRQILMEKSDYIKIWHYYIVYSINYIIESLCKNNNTIDFEKVKELRKHLVGDDLNIFFNNDLKNILNVSTSVDSHLILDEDNLPEEQRLLCEWIMSLDQIMFDLVSEARKSSIFQDVRAFLELNTNTIDEYKKKINSIIKGNKRHRELYFPTN